MISGGAGSILPTWRSSRSLLQTLILQATEVADQTPKVLSACLQLRVLDLSRTAVGDAGIADLAPSLRLEAVLPRLKVAY